MPGIYEADQAVPVKDYGEELYVVQSHEVPKLRLIGEDSNKMTQMLQDWEAESRSRLGFAGVKDGADVSAYNGQTAVAMVAYGTHQRESWMVTKVMSKTTTAGIKNQVKHQRTEAMKRLREVMERSVGSAQEMQRGTSAAEYNHRGAFCWLNHALQSVQAVDASLQLASGCIHTGTTAALTEAAFEAMVSAAATQVGHAVSLKGFVGSTLKSSMSDWGKKIPVTQATEQALQSFNINVSEKRLLKMVNTFEFDDGLVETMVDYNLVCDPSTGADSAYTPLSGLFLDMSRWKKRYMQNVTEFALPDLGGGPRGYADVVWMLKCGLPAGQMVVYSASAT